MNKEQQDKTFEDYFLAAIEDETFIICGQVSMRQKQILSQHFDNLLNNPENARFMFKSTMMRCKSLVELNPELESFFRDSEIVFIGE